MAPSKGILMKPNILILVVILVLMGAAFGTAMTYPYYQARLAPLTISGSLFILAAVQLAREIRASKAAGSPKEEKKAKPSELPRFGFEIAWFAGFALAIFLFGFIISIFGMSLAYMRAHGAKWRISVLISGLLTPLSWGIFSYILGAHLYQGLIFKWLFK